MMEAKKKIVVKENVVGKDELVLNRSETAWKISINGFPKDLWKVWDKACENSFQDIRWVKIWSDHLKAQAFDLLEKSQYLVIEKSLAQEQEEEVVEKGDGLGLLNPESEETEGKEDGK